MAKDNEMLTIERAKATPCRMENSLISFPHKDGVANIQFDKDYDFQITTGDVIIDEEDQS